MLQHRGPKRARPAGRREAGLQLISETQIPSAIRHGKGEEWCRPPSRMRPGLAIQPSPLTGLWDTWGENLDTPGPVSAK